MATTFLYSLSATIHIFLVLKILQLYYSTHQLVKCYWFCYINNLYVAIDVTLLNGTQNKYVTRLSGCSMRMPCILNNLKTKKRKNTQFPLMVNANVNE